MLDVTFDFGRHVPGVKCTLFCPLRLYEDVHTSAFSSSAGFTGDIAGPELKSFEQVLRAYKVTQQTKGNNSARQTRDATTKTGIAYGNSTWRASKYKVYKLHQSTSSKKGCPQWHLFPPF